jgi:hypothetical protein
MSEFKNKIEKALVAGQKTGFDFNAIIDSLAPGGASPIEEIGAYECSLNQNGDVNFLGGTTGGRKWSIIAMPFIAAVAGKAVELQASLTDAAAYEAIVKAVDSGAEIKGNILNVYDIKNGVYRATFFTNEQGPKAGKKLVANAKKCVDAIEAGTLKTSAVKVSQALLDQINKADATFEAPAATA